MTTLKLIKDVTIVSGEQVILEGVAGIHGTNISFVGTREEFRRLAQQTQQSYLAGEVIEANGAWLIPGFIDIHVHGGYGADFMDASQEALDTITRFHAQHGTTALLATTMTSTKDNLERVLEAVYQYRQQEMPYASLLGVHLEGPFLSPKWPGAQNPAFIVPPQLSWLEEWSETYPQTLRMLTLAPENEGALEIIQWANKHGIIPASGHTDASYEQMLTAINHGLKHAVHMYNAMTGLHHRQPGSVGAILTDDRISTEIIADGVHVHPACIKLLVKQKGTHQLMMISDAISAAGLGPREYQTGGLDVVVADHQARLKVGNSLAGSTLTTIAAFSYLVEQCNLDVAQASQMASSNPAKLLGISHQTGQITTGLQADLLLLSQDLSLQKVWVSGKEIHR